MRQKLHMHASLLQSKTLYDPAIERVFMESYYVRATERHQHWADAQSAMTATARNDGLDCHVVVRELERRMKSDLLCAEEAMDALAEAKPRTWGRAQINLERAWESLETEWLLWTVFSLR